MIFLRQHNNFASFLDLLASGMKMGPKVGEEEALREDALFQKKEGKWTRAANKWRGGKKRKRISREERRENKERQV